MAADIEAILVDWLEAALQVRFVTQLPDSLETPGNLPIGHLYESHGFEAYPTIDISTVDVDVYGADLHDTKVLAEAVRTQFLRHLIGVVFDGGLTSVNKVRNNAKPTRLPYDNPEICKLGAEYRLHVHSRA